MKIGKLVIGALVFLLIGSFVFAQTAKPAEAADHRDFNVAFPVYFFDDYTVSGIQAGYQFQKCLIRLENDFVNVNKDGKFSTFLMPSAAIYYTEEWSPDVRVSQGINVGCELGTEKPIEVNTVNINFLFSVEFLATKNKSFYIEMGPSLGIIPRSGTITGGSVIGGGIRMFF